MAIVAKPASNTLDPSAPFVAAAQADPLAQLFSAVMSALASLKLTVVLFALGIFVVLVGTLAQTEMDIWQAIPAYFRTLVMWVDIRLFFPPSFFGEFRARVPALSLPAPGGLTVGVLMMVNLLAAHLWRFQIQSRGLRLGGGLGVIAAGAIVTWLIIEAGHNAAGLQAAPPFSWQTFWLVSRVLLVAVTLASLWLLVQYGVAPLWQAPRFGLRAKLTIVGGLFDALLLVPVFYFVIAGYYIGDEGARILWQLSQGLIGGAIMLAGCWLVFQKRGPVVLLHAGVGLLMINELVVAKYHAENQMTLMEGETSNYLRDIRSTELAFVNRAGEQDQHIVLPYALLAENAAQNAANKKYNRPLQPLADVGRKLPVEVLALATFRNHDLQARKEGDGNPATAGRGLKETIVERPAAKGTGGDGAVDFAAAYVQLRERGGKDLGVYLFSQFDGEQPNPFQGAEIIETKAGEFHTTLRFKRSFLPYQVSLVDVRKDDYLASDTPRNYSSDILLEEPAKGVQETVHIKMNNPLRYAGQTFYQSGYSPGRPMQPRETTTLAVVKNTGWMTPYVACSIVALAMFAHFYQTLVTFVQKQERSELASASGGWDRMSLFALGGALLLGLLYSGSLLARGPQPERGGLDLEAFGALPAAHKGRVKPMDTLARVTLLEISKSESVKTAGGRISATQWLLDVISDKAEDHKVFRIEDEEVLQLFGLEPRSPFRFSVNELRPKFEEFLAQLKATEGKKEDELTRKQVRLRELYRSLDQMITLRMAFNPPQLPKLPSPEELQDPALRQQVGFAMQMAISEATEELKRRQPPLALPVRREGEVVWMAPHDAWVNLQMQRARGETPDPAYEKFEAIVEAYAAKDVFQFSQAVANYQQQLAERAPADYHAGKVNLELWFNRVQPFTQGLVLYILAFGLAIVGCAVGGFTQKWSLSWAAFGLITATLVLHTVALVLRVYLSGRPPVTNLYSSAVFIGWGCVLMGVLIELLFGRGIGNLQGASSGFASLIIASYLGAGGDTIEVMQAVLDTQFWLATHVTCITLGYATTFVAGFLGLLYVLLGLGTPLLKGDLRKLLFQLIYGVTCFSIFFSFVGTVLGGLWADDSWGRFWGWDPKENGALIIVLWNALVLHARWDRLVGERGLAVLAIGGNIVTAWSWFGVNQLGVGLHSYGFTSGVVLALGGFVVSQLLLIGLGMLPMHWWWSYRCHPKPAL